MLNPYIAPGICKTRREKNLTAFRQYLGTSENIIHALCRAYDTTYQELQSSCRKRKYVEPRQICCYLLCEMTSLTLIQIGKIFNKDHSNVIVCRQVIADRLSVDKAFARKIEMIKAELI